MTKMVPQPADGQEPTREATSDTDAVTTETEAAASGDAESVDAGDGDRDENALPEWARKELSDVRNEAARYRISARELREALGAAKSPEEYAAVSARVTELEAELHRERLGRQYQLPEVFAALISGETDEAREEHAKALAGALDDARGTSLPVGRGGLDPTQTQEPRDPASLAGLVPRGRR